MKIIRFIKNWTLPIAMIMGALSYFVYVNIPFLAPTRPFVERLVAYIQPSLIFVMLFVSFCKVNPRDLRPCAWHVWLVVLQVAVTSLLAMWLILCPDMPGRVIVEGAIVCFICPTATAAAVITGKLGGSAASLTTYTIISNLAAAIVAPILLPMVHPNPDLTFLPSFLLIMSKVFPLLICPFLAAWLVRICLPKLHARLIRCKDLAFYLWAVALAIAIAITVKSIVHSQIPLMYEIGIAAVSLAACALQFAVGKHVGSHYGDRISAGQGLGQKNTVFAIWLGYTFLTPITSIAGGFYSVWHNIVNTYQLYKKREKDEMEGNI